MSEVPEILDLVNESDEVIGSLDRAEVYRRGYHNFRLVYGLLVNNENKLWIPRRTDQKVICPGHLDCSFGGHVKSGETYDEAFARELFEELNIRTKDKSIIDMGTLSPFTDGSYAFANVRALSSDSEPDYNREDFTGGEWLSPEQIMLREQQGDKIKSDLSIICAALISNRLVLPPEFV